MKALSIWQPWASAIVTGAKTIETRSWATSYRGPLLIHAGKNRLHLHCIVRPLMKLNPDEILPLGALIARAELVDCQPSEELIRTISTRENKLGDFRPRRYGWILANVRQLPEQIPYRGRQRLFNVPDELVQAGGADG